MKPFKQLVLLTFLSLVSFTLTAAEQSGYSIAKKVLFLHSLPVEKEEQEWTLSDNKGNIKKHLVTRSSRQMDDGGYRHLIQLASKTAAKSIAILIWQHYNQPNRQWLYLPSQNRLQSLSGRGQGSAFIGSDFNYEDLLIDTTDKFEYHRLADEKINGKDCFVLDIIPSNKITRNTSSYKHRKTWIQKSNYFIIRTDFFDRRDHLVKRRSTLKMEQVTPAAWRETEALMENFKTEHKTQLVVINRNTEPNAAPKAIFNENYLLK